ncbi:MAG: signal recognition particle-docking protein FtsY, partial [Nocardioides kribbensis]
MEAIAILILVIALVGVALVATVTGLVVTRRRKPAPLPDTHTDVLGTPVEDGAEPVELSSPPATLEPEAPEAPVEPDTAPAPTLERPESTASRLQRLRQRLAGSQGALGRGLLAL